MSTPKTTAKKPLIPLAKEPRAAITTEEAAGHLCLSPKYLARLASQGKAPITPIKYAEKFLWPTDAIRKLLGV